MTTSISKEERQRILKLIAKENKDELDNLAKDIRKDPAFKELVEEIIKTELENCGILRFIREITQREVKRIINKKN